MDRERLRWITSPPTLDRFDIGVRLAAVPSGMLATYSAIGYSDRRRGSLWSVSDTVPTGGDTLDLHSHLWAILTAAVDVRPITTPAMERALAGEYWEQRELPF